MIALEDTRFILVREDSLRPVGDLVTGALYIVSGGNTMETEGGRDPGSRRVGREAYKAAQAEKGKLRALRDAN